MTTNMREYVGSRYVPIFGRKDENSINWDNTKPYEPLTIVLYQGNSYTSRQFVPIGIEITNQLYWALTGNYNAQVEQYRQEVIAYTVDQTAKFDIRGLDFDTVTDMKNCEYLKAGAIVHTLGYRSAGDKGGAWYLITDSGTANERDIIACGTLFANLVNVEDYVTPEQFGAYGDGSHDDVAAIQAATDTLLPVHFAAKTYNIGASVLLPKSDFIGNDTIIKFVSGDASEHRIKYDGVSHIKTCGIKFDTSAVQKGIGIFDSSFLDFEDCFFEAGTFTTEQDIWIVRTLDLYTDWHDIKIARCKFNMVAPNAEGGLWIRNYDGTNGEAYDCIIEECDFTHCTLDECIAIWSTNIVRNITIRECSFDCNWSSPIFIQTSGIDTLIENCNFTLTQGYTTNRNPDSHSSLLTNSRIFASAKQGDSIPSTIVRNCNIQYTPAEVSPYKKLRLHDTTNYTDADKFIFDHCKINYGMEINYTTMIDCEIDNVAIINYSVARYSTIKYQSLNSGQMSQGGVIYDSCIFDLASNALFMIQGLVTNPVEILNCTINNAAQRIFFSNLAIKSRFIGNIINNTSYDIAYCGSEDGVMICVDNILISSSSGIATQAGDNKVIDNNIKIAPSA